VLFYKNNSDELIFEKKKSPQFHWSLTITLIFYFRKYSFKSVCYWNFWLHGRVGSYLFLSLVFIAQQIQPSQVLRTKLTAGSIRDHTILPQTLKKKEKKCLLKVSLWSADRTLSFDLNSTPPHNRLNYNDTSH